jgi:RNA polymerase sigma-54 factor
MAIKMGQSIHLGLGQGLAMTPQLQQAIKLLQLSRLELEQFVETQMAENPVLEEVPSEGLDEYSPIEKEFTEAEAVSGRLEEAAGIVDSIGKTKETEVDWERLSNYEESRSQASTSGSKNGFDDDTSNYENMVTKANTLQEHVLALAHEVDFSEEELRIAELIAGNIDDRGYLTQSLEDLCEKEACDRETAEGVLDTIQHFDPPGIAARDLKECLLIQIRHFKLRNGIVEKIIGSHLAALESRNYSLVAKALGITLEQVYTNVAVIIGLDPIPGRQFGPEATQYVIPDVYVFKMGTEWVVSMNEDGLPRLKISPFYKDMLKDQKAISAKKDEGKDYLDDKIKSAKWIIKSMEQRQRTILRVTEKILERQKEFFEYGIQYLKPMVLRDIADILELHESTISRVTTNKYVHTPRGIFELKFFFNSAISRSDGESVANEAVKSRIAELIKHEDAVKPFSDQQLLEILLKENIDISRRTIAKYREQLGILPSSKRRKPF